MARKTNINFDGRYRLPPLRLQPSVWEELRARAEDQGYTLAYYVLYLIGRDLGYLPPRVSEKNTRAWLRNRTPDKVFIPRRHVSDAVRGLRRLEDDDPGCVFTTKEVADAAEITYQQAYRQLSRDPQAEKSGNNRWSTV